MSLLNQEFLDKHENTFWTENVALFLYSIIKTTRPKNIIEIGFGYTTNFIGQAIKDIENEDETYDAKLTVVDNFSTDCGQQEREEDSLYSIIDDLDSKKLKNVVTVVNMDVYEYFKTQEFLTSSFDLIWADFGNGEDYLEHFKLFLNVLEEGGTLVMHNTIASALGRIFLLEAELIVRNRLDLEMITFHEPHKWHQNSYTVFKKKKDTPITAGYYS